MKKKLCFSLVVLISTSTLFSCSSDSDNTDKEQAKITDEVEAMSYLKIRSVGERLSLKKLKSSDQTSFEQEILTDQSNNVVIVKWKEWGHGKTCKGAGLCQAIWFPTNLAEYQNNLVEEEPIDGIQTFLQLDLKEKQYYMDIELKESVPANIDSKALTLKIDDVIALDTYKTDAINNKSLLIRPGQYKLNDSVGPVGGYRIYLDIY